MKITKYIFLQNKSFVIIKIHTGELAMTRLTVPGVTGRTASKGNTDSRMCPMAGGVGPPSASHWGHPEGPSCYRAALV